MSLFFLVISASYYLGVISASYYLLVFSIHREKARYVTVVILKLWDDLVYALLVEFTNTLLKYESSLKSSMTRRIGG